MEMKTSQSVVNKMKQLANYVFVNGELDKNRFPYKPDDMDVLSKNHQDVLIIEDEQIKYYPSKEKYELVLIEMKNLKLRGFNLDHVEIVKP